MALTNPQETTDERPVCVEYASGRVFYGLKNVIYYSQVMEGASIDKMGNCYQQNDPTSEQLNNLLATDGGTIEVDNAANIIQIKQFLNGVLVYARNGVWYLAGPDSGFTATEFSLRLVSEAGCISPQSVIAVESSQYYWSLEGIFQIATNEFGQVVANSIVEGTIQTLYNDVTKKAKQKSTGTYNRLKKQIEWHYSSGDQDGATEYKHAKDLSLMLDLRTGGFWKQEYDATLVQNVGDFIASSFATSFGTEEFGDVKVVITLGTVSSTQEYKVNFATKQSLDFIDFDRNDIQTAFIETGYEALDKPSNKKAIPYITTHFKQTEENWVVDGGGFKLDLQSGCQMRAKWDWNNSIANGRWSPNQQAYRFRRIYVPTQAEPFDSGETVITTKNKMLGRGNALSIRFEQEANKDMQILGYTSQFSVKGKM